MDLIIDNAELCRELEFRLIQNKEIDNLPLITQRYVLAAIKNLEEDVELIDPDLYQATIEENETLLSRVKLLTIELNELKEKSYAWQHEPSEYIAKIQADLEGLSNHFKIARGELKVVENIIDSMNKTKVKIKKEKK